MAGDWTDASKIDSARALKAIAYGDRMAAIVNGESSQTWDEALLPLIDAARFQRRGNERTGMDWPTYRAMLQQWGEHSGRYSKVLHRASEVGDVVYLDLEERAQHKDGSIGALRSISIYEFDEADRIVGVDVIMGFHEAA
jgi:hypothetical protein